MHHIPNYDHSSATVPGAGRGRSFRQTVCRHWLRGLCMKAEACGFLHQYDKARMPICRFFRLHGECREHDCVYKHTNEDIKECNMYVLFFASTLCNEWYCVWFFVWYCRLMKVSGFYYSMQWMRLCLVLSLVMLYWQVQAWVLSEWFWVSVQTCQAAWTSTSSWGSSSEDTATDFLQSWA